MQGLESKSNSESNGVEKVKDSLKSELHSLDKRVIQFFDSKDTPIESKNIVDCHILPLKNIKAKLEILIRLVNKKHKIKLLKLLKLKGTEVYLN